METRDLFDGKIGKGALLSDCRVYRYRLWRVWDAGKGVCAFIGLNPSTADENVDDPTIRRCISFARKFGCGSLEMLNLFAFRSTDPKALRDLDNPVGNENDYYIREVTRQCELVIAAWGVHGKLGNRDIEVMELIGLHKMRCLGVTKDGCPRHPLYLPEATEHQRFDDALHRVTR